MSAPVKNETIAPRDFLPLGHARGAKSARRIFHSMMSAKKREGIGTLHLVETYGDQPRDFTFGRGGNVAELTVHSRDAYAALVFGGSRGLGRSYVNGLWETPDVTALIGYLFRATQFSRQRLDTWARRVDPLRRMIRRDEPTAAEDRENIHAHYDLSNEFFSLMLDETMGYSCGIFRDPTTSLRDAQVEKFDRLCRKLQLGPNDHVLEIGTGWGGFAMHAAKNYGARVTTTTISKNQRDEAVARIEAAGLSHQITVLEDHYEDLSGTFDALVSVEMIEAVNWRQYRHFFAKCSSLLSERGRMALQAITIADQSFDRAKYHDDFIRDLIFPGGCLPSVAAIADAVARATDLKIVDLDDIGLHYARTLDAWRRNVHERDDDVRALGFDERFSRLWDLYLGYCEAAFLERHISDVQIVLHKPRAAGFSGYRPS